MLSCYVIINIASCVSNLSRHAMFRFSESDSQRSSKRTKNATEFYSIISSEPKVNSIEKIVCCAQTSAVRSRKKVYLYVISFIVATYGTDYLDNSENNVQISRISYNHAIMSEYFEIVNIANVSSGQKCEHVRFMFARKSPS